MRVRLKHEALAERLGRSRISQNAWALKLGIHPGHLSKLVNGQRPYPRAATRERMLEVLELSFDELFEVEPPRSKLLRPPAPPVRPTSRPMNRPVIEQGRSGESGMHLSDDLRFSIRGLVKRPALSVFATLTLALGIGANTAIFSVVNGVLLKPLPYPEPERLVQLWQTNAEWIASPNPRFAAMGRQFPLSFPVYNDWLELNPCFDSLGLFKNDTFVATSGEFPEVVRTALVTFGVFDTLGVEPLLGRTFTEAEDQVGGPRLIVLGYGLWKNHYGGSDDIVGRTISYNDSLYTVVGVMPADFAFPAPTTQAWATFDDQRRQGDRNSQSYQAIARLADGVTLESARRQMEAVNQRITERTSGEHAFGVFLQSRLDQVVGSSRTALLVLLGAVGAVLLIAVANIANLMLVRTTERTRELALRSALGAGRGRLLSLLIGESLLLSIAGGFAGVVVAWASLKAIVSLLPASLPRLNGVELDSTVLAAATGLTLLTGLLIGVLPALRVDQLNLARAVGDLSRGLVGGRSRSRSQSLLVAAEIALAFVLLVGAGVLVQSFARLTAVEPGFDSERILTAEVDMRGPAYGPLETRRSFYDRIREQVGTLPGVDGLAWSSHLPFAGGTSSGEVTVETPDGLVGSNFEWSSVSAGYFEVLRIPLREGREFAEADREGADRVIVVSAAAARQFWPDTSPIGFRIKRGAPDSESPWMTIVGVAADVRHGGLHVAPPPKWYQPMAQVPTRFATLALRTHGDGGMLGAAAREQLRSIDPSLPVPVPVPLESRMSSSVSMPRFRTLLMSLFAGLAFLLAIIGIYGVVAYSVAQRTGEIGVRMALGASSRHVLRGVMGRAMALVAVGSLLGLAAALAAVRVLASFLFETQAYDPRTFIAVGFLLATTTLVASWLPARRAAGIDPVASLRTD